MKEMKRREVGRKEEEVAIKREKERTAKNGRCVVQMRKKENERNKEERK